MPYLNISNNELFKIYADTVFYKYRPFKEEYHFNSLSKREIFYSSFESNRSDDPDEGKDVIQLEMPSLGEVESSLRRLMKAEKIRMSSTYYSRYVSEIARNSPLYLDPKKFEKELNEMNERFIAKQGIFCTTLDRSSKFCWSKFADESQGFVIGYKFQGLYNSDKITMGEVEYYDIFRPKLNWKLLFNHSITEDFFQKKLLLKLMKTKYLYKHIKYENEKEVRWIKHDLIDSRERCSEVSSNNIHCVIIGKNMSQANRQILFELCEEGGIDKCKVFEQD